VNNNAGGNQSKRGFDRAYGGKQTEQARELWTYTQVNFAKIAEDMGALGIRVEKPADFPARSKGARGEPSGGDRRGDRHRRARADRGDLVPGTFRPSEPCPSDPNNGDEQWTRIA
jgi:hypothetical protein